MSVAFIILYVKKRKIIYNLIAGVCLGAALLTKWLPALIVLPLWLLIIADSGDFSWKQIIIQFSVFLGITALLFLPWQVYIFHTFPLQAHKEIGSYLQHYTMVLDKQTGPFYEIV